MVLNVRTRETYPQRSQRFTEEILNHEMHACPPGGKPTKSAISIIIIGAIGLIGDITPSTTIALSSETKEMLRYLGEKGESYDQIIRKLVKKAAWKELDERWNRILEDDEFIPLDEL